jgi:KAP family P-loop domain
MLSPKERARRRFWLGVVALISSAAVYPLVYWLISPPQADVTKVRAAYGAWAIGWFALVWGISVLWPRVQRSVAAVAAFVDDPRSAAATGSMTEVSAQLGELIGEAQEGTRRTWRASQRPRFVVVVDDLERCQPPKAVDVCEVAAQLLDHPDVITVLVGDLRVIAASAELKYRDAVERFGKDPDFAADGFGRFFLQKVVQFELELPPVPGERLRQLARSAPATASVHGSDVGHSIPDLARVRPGPLSQWVAMPPSVRRGASSCRKHVAARKFYLCWQGRGPVHG